MVRLPDCWNKTISRSWQRLKTLLPCVVYPLMLKHVPHYVQFSKLLIIFIIDHMAAFICTVPFPATPDNNNRVSLHCCYYYYYCVQYFFFRLSAATTTKQLFINQLKIFQNVGLNFIYAYSRVVFSYIQYVVFDIYIFFPALFPFLLASPTGNVVHPSKRAIH